MRRWLALVGAATMMLALLPLTGGAAAADPDRGVAGSYIVVLRSGEPGAVAAEHSRAHNTSVQHVYRQALRGYAARMSQQAAARIARDPRVDYVEADRVVTTAHHACGHDKPTSYDGPCDEPPSTTTYTVSGQVRDNASTTAAPIGGATVTVSGTGLDDGVTGDEGNYAVAGVAPGAYEVTATADGYEASSQTITVETDTVGVDFALEPVALQPVPWGVGRAGAPLAGNTGAGVPLYVLDTGIDRRHRDLNVSRRATPSSGAAAGRVAASPGGTTTGTARTWPARSARSTTTSTSSGLRRT